jgi:hypothetical protein
MEPQASITRISQAQFEDEDKTLEKNQSTLYGGTLTTHNAECDLVNGLYE